MFREASTVDVGACLRSQVAIVGAGPAGIALSRALAKAGVSCLLLESGGVRPDAASDQLNAGTSTTGEYPFIPSRARAFGGSTTRWYGACVALDPVDFEVRDWIAHSGWPIRADDLAAYEKAARRFLRLPAESAPGPEGDLAGELDADLLVKQVYHSDPLDIGKSYQQETQAARETTCLLRATVTNIVRDEAGVVQRLDLRRPDGETFFVEASCFVLAAGGLENPRLLLASRVRDARGIGNARDVVGRYHMERPIRSVGVLPVGNAGRVARILADRRRVGGGKTEVKLGLTTEARARLKVLDLHARFYRFHRLESDPVIVAAKRRWIGQGGSPGLAGRSGLGAASKLLRYGAWHFHNKLRTGAGFDHLRLLAFMEQEPNPENRVTLSLEKDRFETPLPHLTYRESAQFEDGLNHTLEALSAGLERSGFGRLNCDPETVAPLRHYDGYGFHPMGATRMSDDPATGVTDADLKVHGVHNLFVLGSSVFPTAGAANPTLTIVLLALRLADHLSTLVQGRTVVSDRAPNNSVSTGSQ